MRRIVQVLCAVMLAAALPLAAAGAVSARPAPLRVLVTVAPLAHVVEQVAGAGAVVTVMVPPGADPHTFEPKPNLMAEAARADLYCTVGLEFEKVWVPRFLAANPGLRVVAMDAGLAKLAMPEGGHGHEGTADAGRQDNAADAGHTGRAAADHDTHAADVAPKGGAAAGHDAHDAAAAGEGGHHGREASLDPHVWLSPRLMQDIARNVRDALTAADPENGAAYAAGCEAFVARAKALDGDVAALFAGAASRRFLVFHPSWGYFAHDFGLTQMVVEAGGNEPGPRALAELIAEAREYGVRAVFVSPQFSQRAAAVIAHELGGVLVEADPLARDWEANLRGVAQRMAVSMRGEQ